MARLLSVNEPTIEVPGMTLIKIKLLSSFSRGFAKAGLLDLRVFSLYQSNKNAHKAQGGYGRRSLDKECG